MELKEIVTRYAGQCAKCNREIKEGWTVFFDAKTKKIYCKPCGKILTKGGADTVEEKSNNTSEGMKILTDLVTQVGLLNDILASVEDRLFDLNTDLRKYDERVNKILDEIGKKKK